MLRKRQVGASFGRAGTLGTMLLELEVAAARSVGALSRLAGPRRRHDAAREAPLDGRSRRGRPARGAPRPRLGPRLRDERQDDDDGDGGRDPRRPARLQPLRREPRSRASPPPCSPSRGAELGLFEVDEAALPEVARRVRPRVVALGNLFRDQLDRYGELEHIAERWRGRSRPSCPTTLFVVNADDPLLGELARGREPARHLRRRRPAAMPGRRSSTPPTRRTASSAGRRTLYAAAYVGHLGDYRCPNCGTRAPPARRRPPRDRAARPRRHPTFTLDDAGGIARVELALPGLYNVYNATAAAAIAGALGAPLERSSRGLERFTAAFGRFERIAVGDQRLLMLLIKNPAGANEAVRTLLDGVSPHARGRRAQRRDRRRPGRLVDLGRRLRAAARRARAGRRHRRPRGRARAAVRLRRARPRPDRGRARRSRRALDRGLELTPPGGELVVLPTYTAMLALRGLARRRAATSRSTGSGGR